MPSYNFEDLTDKQFGRLKVLKRHGKDKYNKITWLCKCECGKEKIIRGYSLKRGDTKSCGCLQRESAFKRAFIHGHASKNNQSHEYITWQSMIARCTNPKQDNYKNYGGRGIIVCEKWFDFQNFIKDMGNKPSNKYTIDRIDVNGNYEPSNCKWVTWNEQAINKRLSNRNSSGYKGIWWDKRAKKWKVQITNYGKQIHLGYFIDILDAIESRKQGEIKYWK